MRSKRKHSRIRLAAVLLPIAALWLWSCGDPPTTAVEQRGSIEVEGILPDNSPADSINITLDGDSLGYFTNPHTIENIIAGIHLLEVRTRAQYESDTLDYYSSPQEVEVVQGRTATAEFSLSTDIPESPYVGYMAPDFELNDIDSNPVSLSGLAGEVVLLYFFTAT